MLKEVNDMAQRLDRWGEFVLCEEDDPRAIEGTGYAPHYVLSEEDKEYRRSVECIAKHVPAVPPFVPPRIPPMVVVTRHKGLVSWLWRKLDFDIQDVKVIEHATANDVQGAVVYGVLPLDLAAEAAEVWTVAMPGLRPDQRGQDLTPEEMDEAGAHLVGFKVIRL